MPKISYKDAGVIKDIKQPYVKVGSLWVPAKMVLNKINGAWVEVWPGTKTFIWEGDGFSLNIAQLFGNPKDKANYVFINNGRIGGTYSPHTGSRWDQVHQHPEVGAYALTTGTFPEGSKLTIINNGQILGRGGGGGGAYIYTNDTGGWAAYAGTGGSCLLLQYPTSLINKGNIWAGGGGGGGALVDNDGWVNRNGGAGAGFALGTPATSYDGYRNFFTSGSSGTLTKGSAGDGNIAGGYGGNGGDIAMPGTSSYSPSSGRFWADFNYGRGWIEGAAPGLSIVNTRFLSEFLEGDTPDLVKGGRSN